MDTETPKPRLGHLMPNDKPDTSYTYPTPRVLRLCRGQYAICPDAWLFWRAERRGNGHQTA